MTVGNIYYIFTCRVWSVLYGLPQFNPSNKLTESFFFFNFMPQIPSSIPCATSTSITIHHHNQWDIVVKVSGPGESQCLKASSEVQGCCFIQDTASFPQQCQVESAVASSTALLSRQLSPHFPYLHSPLLSCGKLVHGSSTFNELLKEVTVWDSVFQMPKEIRKSFSGPSSLYN